MNGTGTLGADGDRGKNLPWFRKLPDVPVTSRGRGTAWRHVMLHRRPCNCISPCIPHAWPSPSLPNTDKWGLLWLCWRRQQGAGRGGPQEPQLLPASSYSSPTSPQEPQVSTDPGPAQDHLSCPPQLHGSIAPYSIPVPSAASFLPAQLCSIASPPPHSPSSALAQHFMPGCSW